MQFRPTAIADVVLLVPAAFEDERGYFMETYRADRFREAGIDHPFVQDNHSRSIRGTLRGLHYQLTLPQGKLVRAVTGEIFDVAVDLRRGSATFGRWVGERLSAESRKQLWIPPGFAHGFYVISEWADVLYKCTDYYRADDQRCLRWDDETIAIEWPIGRGAPPLLSAKDRAGVGFAEADTYP